MAHDSPEVWPTLPTGRLWARIVGSDVIFHIRTIQKVEGQRVTVQLRTGKLLSADLSQAAKAGTTVNPVVGLTVVLIGPLDNNGLMNVLSMSRFKAPAWGIDRP